MQLVVIGVHQRNTPVAVRERLAFDPVRMGEALRMLGAYVEEGFIVSTCNRVEVYGLVSRVAAGEQVLRRFLVKWHGVAEEVLSPYLYSFVDADAVRHVFRLASGLDSMVLGEDQILVQLKVAFASAQEMALVGQHMYRLLNGALATGKLVRTHTALARSPVSVVSVAIESARETFGDLARCRVLVLGAGRMAELALKHLRGAAPQVVLIANRTVGRAQVLAERYGAQAWSLADVPQVLPGVDIVLSCTAASEVVLGAEVVGRALVGRVSPLLLLDLAVPRDIDRGVASFPLVRLCDIDDLQVICAANRAARAAEVAQAELLVADEVVTFMHWWESQAVIPTIRALREHAEVIRCAEVDRALAKLPDLSPREQDTIQALSVAIVNKLLHQPIASLKDPVVGGQLAQMVQVLFRLSEEVKEQHAAES